MSSEGGEGHTSVQGRYRGHIHQISSVGTLESHTEAPTIVRISLPCVGGEA